jgi:protein subunit release factor A
MQTDQSIWNAYICFRYLDRFPDSETRQVIQNITNDYLRFAQQQRWKSQPLRLSLSSQSETLDGGLLMEGWAVYDTLSNEFGRQPIRSRTAVQASRKQAVVETVIIPGISDEERIPYQNDVKEERFYAFESAGLPYSLRAAVRLYHLPTNTVATSLEATRIYDLSRERYTLECNRTASWSLLLYSLRSL